MIKSNNTIENLDDIFTDEWYNNVIAATDFALEHNTLNIKEEDLAKYIIDYNIVKQLQEKVLNTLIDTLPKNIDWRGKDILCAFNEFKDIVDSCVICPNFKKYSAKIFFDEKSSLINELLIWQELVNSTYSELEIKTNKLKRTNQYKLQITKVK